MKQAMPKIDSEAIKAEINRIWLNEAQITSTTRARWEKIVDGIVATRGKNKGCLRASAPSHKHGDTYYVWRMVAFHISPMRQHQMMPVTDYFYLSCPSGEWNHDEAMKIAKKLDVLVDLIVDSIPKDQRHGVNRWARALGVF